MDIWWCLNIDKYLIQSFVVQKRQFQQKHAKPDLLCIYIYCAYMFVYLRIIFFYGRMKKEQNQKLVVSHRGPHRSLKLCILKRCGTTTVPWWNQKHFFLPSKNNMDHTIYIYIFRVWILMDFDGFWRILMYFDGLTDFRFLTAWTSPCALKTSAAQVIPRRSAQRELCGCHQIPEVQNKQQKRWSNG